MPTHIHDEGSPWYGYLHAVYGAAPHLPFDLTTLRMLYHHDHRWKRKHPTVEWPMPACVLNHSTSARWARRHGPYSGTLLKDAQSMRRDWHLREHSQQQPESETPWCPAERCWRWYHKEPSLEPDRTSPASSSVLPLTVDFTQYDTIDGGTGVTGGIFWVQREDITQPNDNDHSDALCLPVGTLTSSRAHQHNWIEVVRANTADELTHGAGMWFSVRRGSGIWVDAGHLWQVPGCECEPAKVAQHLRRFAVSSFFGGAANVDQPAINARWPFVMTAFLMNLSSILLHCDGGSPTLVLTSAPAIISRGCAREKCPSCGDSMLTAVCGPGPSTCGPAGIQLRTGSNASQACACSEQGRMLNCNHGDGDHEPTKARNILRNTSRS